MNNSILTVEQVIELIRQNEHPYWTLSLVKGIGQEIQLRKYEPFESDKVNQIAESIRQLEGTLKIFKDRGEYAVFQIITSKAGTSNQGGKCGPFIFDINKNQEPKEIQNPLNGLGILPELHKSELSNLEQKLTLNFERQLFEAERKRAEDAIKERENELKGLESAYKSHINKAADILGEVATRLINQFFGGGNDGSEQPQQMAGSNDANAATVERMASAIYENVAPEDLVNFESMINQSIQQYKKHKGNDIS